MFPMFLRFNILDWFRKPRTGNVCSLDLEHNIGSVDSPVTRLPIEMVPADHFIMSKRFGNGGLGFSLVTVVNM